MEVTVLTPTFNRAHTLRRLHASLLAQTFDRFEWLVIDDGSNDGTGDLIESLRSQSPFPISYEWKPNGGKHTALNRGISLARGHYCAVLDSDDWYKPTALADLLAAWNSIPASQRDAYANVEGLVCLPKGSLLGSPFPADPWDSNSFRITREREANGDTRGMYRTDVLRDFPFPDQFDRQFVPEALVWNRISRRYLTRFVNKVVGFADYQPGGLSDVSASRMLDSLAPRLLFLRELIDLERNLPIQHRARSYANYLRLAYHEGRVLARFRDDLPSRLLATVMLPVGLTLALRDRARAHDGRTGHHRVA